MIDPGDINVLIGCETSGIMREAFLAHGFNAFSNDINPAETPTNRHIQGDIRDLLDDPMWDLLCVMHPPCTRLCRSGRRWMSGPGMWTPPKQLPKGRTWQSMIDEFEAGCALFRACLDAPIPLRAIENPVMNDLAKARIPNLPEPQIVQPWWFGNPAFKATGFYLRGLPELVATDKLTPPEKPTDEYKRWSAIHRMSPGAERARLRSRTFPGVAAAAAAQWGRAAIERAGRGHLERRPA